jgi:hypothetical protein
MQLSALWAPVSLAGQSILGPLPADAYQEGVEGEMVARFKERAERCSRIETSGSRVCNLALEPVNG